MLHPRRFYWQQKWNTDRSFSLFLKVNFFYYHLHKLSNIKLVVAPALKQKRKGEGWSAFRVIAAPTNLVVRLEALLVSETHAFAPYCQDKLRERQIQQPMGKLTDSTQKRQTGMLSWTAHNFTLPTTVFQAARKRAAHPEQPTSRVNKRIFPFPFLELKVREVLHSECGSKSNNKLAHVGV